MHIIDKYIPQLVNVTESAAIACSAWRGMGEEKQADKAAVEAMRTSLDSIEFDAKIVIGEGERDEAPMLYIGETLGSGKEQFDIAVDPLEGTTICANNMENSIAVLAIAKHGDFLHAPDVYMEKLAAPKEVPAELISLDRSVSENLGNIAEHLDLLPSDIAVTVLNRPRHKDLIDQIRKFGAKVKLIGDGDINAVINTAMGDGQHLNLYMGTGGAPEGVLAAAALKTLGGHIQGRLLFNDDQKKRGADEMGIVNFDKIYTMDDMVRGECAFIATGVTDGTYLSGVRSFEESVSTHTMVLTSWNHGVTYLDRSARIFRAS